MVVVNLSAKAVKKAVAPGFFVPVTLRRKNHPIVSLNH